MADANKGSEKPIYRCITKGVKDVSESFEYGLGWVTARRATLKIFDDHLECGDWRIPYDSISQAVLFKTKQQFISGYILKILADSATYQFGLNSNKFWEGELPFPVTWEQGSLKYSKSSLVVRIAIIAFLVWYFFLHSR